MNRALFPVAVMALLVGCAPPTTFRTETPYVEADFAPYTAKGTSVITGQAFLKTRGGDVKFGAGCQVILMPATKYIKARDYFIQRLGTPNVEQISPLVYKYERRTTADGTGNFEFRDLPAGEYSIY